MNPQTIDSWTTQSWVITVIYLIIHYCLYFQSHSMLHWRYRWRTTTYPTNFIEFSSESDPNYWDRASWVRSSWLCWGSRIPSLQCCSCLHFNTATKVDCFHFRPFSLGNMPTSFITDSVVAYLTVALLRLRRVRLLMFARLRYKHPFSTSLFPPSCTQSLPSHNIRLDYSACSFSFSWISLRTRCSWWSFILFPSEYASKYWDRSYGWLTGHLPLSKISCRLIIWSPLILLFQLLALLNYWLIN